MALQQLEPVGRLPLPIRLGIDHGAGGGEQAALTLWREAGIRVLPGGYLSRPVSHGLGEGDPGAAYLRLALVATMAETEEGLARVRDHLAA